MDCYNHHPPRQRDSRHLYDGIRVVLQTQTEAPAGSELLLPQPGNSGLSHGGVPVHHRNRGPQHPLRLSRRVFHTKRGMAEQPRLQLRRVLRHDVNLHVRLHPRPHHTGTCAQHRTGVRAEEDVNEIGCLTDGRGLGVRGRHGRVAHRSRERLRQDRSVPAL